MRWLWAALVALVGVGLPILLAYMFDRVTACQRPIFFAEADPQNERNLALGKWPMYAVSLRNRCDKSFANVGLGISLDPTSGRVPLTIRQLSSEPGIGDRLYFKSESPREFTLSHSEFAAGDSFRQNFEANQLVTVRCTLRVTGPQGPSF